MRVPSGGEYFRDPHVSPELRQLTAYDAAVRRAMMDTPGIRELVVALVAAVEAYLAGPSASDVTVAVGCAGGRHRAATTAAALDAVLRGDQDQAAEYGLASLAADRPAHDVTLSHRDLARPVVHR
jgi:UPF0042 nucleotide-binding protein